ncbi:MAG: chemotaxis protein CheD [Myxococcaceae bacterium]
MTEITVAIADYRVSADPDAQLTTYALGSCIAVTAFDPIRKVAGMIHFMLPVSSSAPEKAEERPAMFADTGVPMLFNKLYEHGCTKGGLVVKVAGGARLNDANGHFEIGQRNYMTLRKIFWKAGVKVSAEDVGGEKSRTLKLHVGSGRLVVSSMGTEADL